MNKDKNQIQLNPIEENKNFYIKENEFAKSVWHISGKKIHAIKNRLNNGLVQDYKFFEHGLLVIENTYETLDELQHKLVHSKFKFFNNKGEEILSERFNIVNNYLKMAVYENRIVCKFNDDYEMNIYFDEEMEREM